MADEPHAAEVPTASADGASATKSDVDDLARDLPGLPFETKHLRADERGVLVRPGLFRRWLGRREQLLPWSEIVGHRWRLPEIVLERQRPDECEVHGVAVPAGRAGRRTIGSAWREYVLRRIERDGALRGTHLSPLPRVDYVFAVLLGIALLVLALILVPAVRTSSIGRRETLPVAIAALFGLVAGTTTLLAGIRERRLVRAALLHWYRWSVTTDAITCRLDGEQETLAPSVTAAIGSGFTRIEARAVPTKYLTYSRVMEPLTFAMLSRKGAGLCIWDWRGVEEAMVSLLFWCGTVLAAFGAAVAWADPPPPSLWLAAALPAATYVPVSAAVYVWFVIRARRITADGRAMLERLGW